MTRRSSIACSPRARTSNARNDYNSTPLSEAAVVGNAAVIRKLLKAGADVEAANADGQTALMIVARSSNVEAAKLLIKAGANVNAREHWRGQTALMWAAAQSQPGMVHLLVKHGASVNERSSLTNVERQVTAEPRMQQRPPGGLTPLLYAARSGCLECAKALVRGGADINLPDPEGITPLIMAGLNFSFDVAALPRERGRGAERVGYVGPLAALRRRGHEHGAHRRSRRPPELRMRPPAPSS